MADSACQFCGHQFNQNAAGLYGCPNCHGEGLSETEAECAARNEPQAAAFGRGGLGSGVGDFRQAADNAARITANVERIIGELERGETGVEIVVGPFNVFGLTVPAFPLHFRLKK